MPDIIYYQVWNFFFGAELPDPYSLVFLVKNWCFLLFQSFTAKHLGGVIHLVDTCDEDVGGGGSRRSDSVGVGVGNNGNPFNALTTFRPKLRGYVKRKKHRKQVSQLFANLTLNVIVVLINLVIINFYLCQKEDEITKLRNLLRARYERMKNQKQKMMENNYGGGGGDSQQV